jgi:hypothetical protein
MVQAMNITFMTTETESFIKKGRKADRDQSKVGSGFVLPNPSSDDLHAVIVCPLSLDAKSNEGEYIRDRGMNLDYYPKHSAAKYQFLNQMIGD